MNSTTELQTPSFDNQKEEEEFARQKRREALKKDPEYIRTMAMIDETERKNQSVSEHNILFV